MAMTMSVLQDFSVCVVSYCFNSLHESSVLSLEKGALVIEDEKMTARQSMVKGKAGSRFPLVAYHRRGDMASPIDFIQHWKTVQGRHLRFLGLSGEPSDCLL